MGFIKLSFAPVVLAVLAWVGLRVSAGMVVLPWKPKTVECLSRSGDFATFEQTPATSAPGLYACWTDDRRNHAVIGEVVRLDPRARTVTRRILSESGGRLKSGAAEWIGMVWIEPIDLDLPWSSVVIDSPAGGCPAWLFPGTTQSDHWVIHVHGLRVVRDSPLRGVVASSVAGVTSLVVSYRGDGVGPVVPKSASMLGQTEWPDVDAAVLFALEHGAKRITLMGWSNGGGIALRVAEQSLNRGRISDLVLVGPVSNWAEVIAFGAKAAHLPRWVSSVVVAALGWRPFARSVGLPSAIDFDALDWTSRPRLSIPTLIIHSSDDDEVPISLSRQIRKMHPDLVTLAEFTGALHTMEWNADRPRFEKLVTERLVSDLRH
ncbi:hypothetical protein B7R21_18380 [Subtercola boreus]|uniref:Uncharacterized protein n=1 Tax=Subtercola boreus TaxID=120213 RepID=A0A3E0VB03_9MICO|nr:alpha/beta fold hydrolase [Subtercola boreus]RFA06815.1 hypothetical protein B7R21_18380 [Subtercola boreus]